MGNRRHKKYVKVLPSVGGYLALLSLIFLLIPELAISVSSAQNDAEAEAVMRAARTYLDAEVRSDYSAVYACFAPSSDYTRTNSYEQYIAEVQSAQEHVVEYRIVAITYIKNNEKRLTSSIVEKIAEVEADVTLLNTTTGKRSDVNIGFIFLKEGGKWYKS